MKSVSQKILTKRDVLDKFFGLIMFLIASIIFIYYSIWTLIMEYSNILKPFVDKVSFFLENGLLEYLICITIIKFKLSLFC
ncbi:hypothetical protein PCK1_002013 [Pneumocystis canis]|nr:hypothetical protein PCK1_002013 [Pneumocystis canis]